MKIEDFTEEMRNEIISAAKQSFMKIGVNADVDVKALLLKNNTDFIVRLSTKVFNTTPSIFKSIAISGDSRPCLVDGTSDVYDLDFRLSYWFETYSGGRNGTELGVMKFRLIEHGYDVVRFMGFVI